MAKEFARAFYDSTQWKHCRTEYKKSRHYLCERCLAKGIYKPGVIVHHKIELTPFNINIPEIALNFDNLELLCRDCHNEEHEVEWVGGWKHVNKVKQEKKKSKKRYTVDENGTVTCK